MADGKFSIWTVLWIKFLSDISPSSEKALKVTIMESVLGPSYWHSESSGITMLTFLIHFQVQFCPGLQSWAYFYSFTWSYPVWPGAFVEDFAFGVYLWFLYLKKGGGGHRCLESCPCLLFWSTDERVCVYANTIFLLWQLCGKIWNKGWWGPLEFLIPFRIILADCVCVSIWILRFVFNLCEYFCWNFDGNCIRSVDCFW